MSKLTVKTDAKALYLSFNGSEHELKTATFPLNHVAFSILETSDKGHALVEHASQYFVGPFSNAWESVNSLKQIEKALGKQRKRNRVASAFRFGVWPALGILSILFFTVSMNGAIQNIGPSAAPQNVTGYNNQPASINPPQQPAVEQQPSTPQQPTQLNAGDLTALQDAIKNGHFSVQLSSGHERSLYVFSDPLCPHCRDIEPRLEALSRQYNIYVMPVSIIGDQRSEARIAPVLDAEPSNRAKLWHDTVMMPYGQSDPDMKGYKGNALTIVNANDIAFAKFGFIGTPTIVADNGKVLMPSQLQDDSRLALAIGK